MKDSGVAWIGDIPKTWTVRTLKSLASVNDSVLKEDFSEDSIIEYVDIGSVSADKGISFTQTMEFRDAPSRARRLVKHGDVIVSTVRTYLRAIAPIVRPAKNLVISTGFAVIRPRKYIVSAFAKYSLQDEIFMDEVTARSVGVSYPAINAGELMTIPVVVPPLPEQRAIADYLDQQTALIDQRLSNIADKQAVLSELRKAIIHEAVTKGLDKTVPMKDSGVAWIGEIPQDWLVKRMKDSFMPNSRPQPNKTVLSLSYGNVIIKDVGEKKGVTPESYDSYQGVYPGDVVLRLTDLQNDQKSLRVGRATVRGIITSAYLCVSSRGLDDRYMAYLLHDVGDIQKLFYGLGGGVRQSMKFADLAELLFPLPSKEEQIAIADHLDQQTSQIDAQLATLNEQVQTLKELRKAIIHEAVIGKIDLSGARTGKE